MARKRRAEQPLVRRPALTDPKNLSKPQAAAVKGSTQTALRNVGASRTRPESRRDTLPDLTVWIVWTALTAAGLLALCALVWVIAGAPS